MTPLTPTPTPTHTPAASLTPTRTPSKTQAEIIADVERAVVLIKTPDGQGSGFIFDKSGWVATAAHVVEGFSSVTVVVEGIDYHGRVVNRDHELDAALILLEEGGNFPSINIGNSDSVTLGDDILVLGYPLSDVLGDEINLSKGIVSSFRSLDGLRFIHIDAAVNPGSSGGPLIRTNGDVVGMVTLGMLGYEGIGLAVATNEFSGWLTWSRGSWLILTPTPVPTPTPSITSGFNPRGPILTVLDQKGGALGEWQNWGDRIIVKSLSPGEWSITVIADKGGDGEIRVKGFLEKEPFFTGKGDGIHEFQILAQGLYHIEVDRVDGWPWNVIIWPVGRPRVTSEPTATYATYGNGSYWVGTDIPAGTYVNNNPGPNCYYEFLGWTGTDYVLNGSGIASDGQVVRILPSDEVFRSVGCSGVWIKQ